MSDQPKNTEQKQTTDTKEGWKEQLIKSVAGENEGIKTALNILLNDITLGAAVGMIGMWFMKGKGMAEDLEAAKKENKEMKELIEKMQEQLKELRLELKEMKTNRLPAGRQPAEDLNGNDSPGKSRRRYNTSLLD